MAALTGVSQEQLNRAIRLILDRVKNHDQVSYRAFSHYTGITSPVSIANVLAYISELANKSGCGLPSVVVRGDSAQVGLEFFLLAQALGYEIKPGFEDVFVLEQTAKVYAQSQAIENALTALVDSSGFGKEAAPANTNNSSRST
jgi:hypothetical protein